VFPYCDLAFFRRNSGMPPDQVDYVEQSTPGFVAQAIASNSSWINGRLRKRLGNTGKVSSLPLGQTPAALLPAGTAPPPIVLLGRPRVGSYEVQIQVTTPGALGVAVVQWTSDGGITWTVNVVTAPTVALGATGITAQFSAGTYSADNVYAADTPVPRIVLRWLVVMTTWDTYDRRGVGGSQDPKVARAEKAYDEAKAECKEAADSVDGLFDLPTSEDADSAQTTGDPLHYTQHSPYTSARIERELGSIEDSVGGRTGFAPNAEFGDA
jgi:hypothetical protein